MIILCKFVYLYRNSLLLTLKGFYFYILPYHNRQVREIFVYVLYVIIALSSQNRRYKNNSVMFEKISSISFVLFEKISCIRKIFRTLKLWVFFFYSNFKLFYLLFYFFFFLYQFFKKRIFINKIRYINKLFINLCDFTTIKQFLKTSSLRISLVDIRFYIRVYLVCKFMNKSLHSFFFRSLHRYINSVIKITPLMGAGFCICFDNNPQRLQKRYQRFFIKFFYFLHCSSTHCKNGL